MRYYCRLTPSSEDSMETSGESTDKKQQGLHKQLTASDALIKNLLDAVMIAASNEKLQEVVGTYFEDVCRHFALSFIPNGLRGSHIKNQVFLDSVIDALCAETRTLSKCGLQAIDILIETRTILTKSLEGEGEWFIKRLIV